MSEVLAQQLATTNPTEFRRYGAEALPVVRDFYQAHHTRQTYDFAKRMQSRFYGLGQRELGIWDALKFLDTLIDQSDPDTQEKTQTDHLLTTSEAMRKNGEPEWFVLVGFLHDLGKVLCLFGLPQWAVVGDTFVLGCPYPDTIVFSEFLKDNPDMLVPDFQARPTGIYERGCGLRNTVRTFSHDDYMGRVLREANAHAQERLPEAAFDVVEFHSLYPWHNAGSYHDLMDDHDREVLPIIQRFQQYDLYTKDNRPPKLDEVRPYYDGLFRRFLSPVIRF